MLRTRSGPPPPLISLRKRGPRRELRSSAPARTPHRDHHRRRGPRRTSGFYYSPTVVARRAPGGRDRSGARLFGSGFVSITPLLGRRRGGGVGERFGLRPRLLDLDEGRSARPWPPPRAMRYELHRVKHPLHARQRDPHGGLKQSATAKGPSPPMRWRTTPPCGMLMVKPRVRNVQLRRPPPQGRRGGGGRPRAWSLSAGPKSPPPPPARSSPSMSSDSSSGTAALDALTGGPVPPAQGQQALVSSRARSG